MELMSAMEKWKQAVSHPDSTVESLLRKIDEAGTQLAFIVDEYGVLLGVVSDGDVRRGLLRGKGLDIPAREIMNSDPKVAYRSTSRIEIQAIFDKFKVSLIPLIEDDGTLVDVLDKSDVNSHGIYDNKIVIMAGGRGVRLLPLTEDRPKPLIEVGGKPILESIIDGVSMQGFKNFVISVGYKARMIEDYFQDGNSWGVNIEYVREEESLGTAGALSLMAEMPKKPFVVMNGDILNRVDLVALLNRNSEKKEVLTVVARQHLTHIPFGVIDHQQGVLHNIVEKPTIQHLISAGIYACSPEVLQYCAKNEFLAMTTLIEMIKSAGQLVGVHETDAFWLDIGRLEELDRAQREWKTFSDD
jgi:dTDP-glucose pyrophosphorylase